MLSDLILVAFLLGAPAEGVLRVGLDTRSPPGAFVPGLDFSREDLLKPPVVSKAQLATLRGYEVDIMTALASRLGVRTEVVPTPWPFLEHDLLAQRFELILNSWTPSEETPDTIVATEPYQHWSLQVVVRRDDDRVHRVRDLAGLRVGHLADPSVRTALRAMGAGLGSTFLAFADPGTLAAALRAKELDAMLFDSFFLVDWARRNPEIRVVAEPLNRLGYHIGVRRSDADLFRRVERALDALLRSPDMAAIRNRWKESLPADPPPAHAPE
jgi:ABC-type amino acid transport substrate-binding protein